MYVACALHVGDVWGVVHVGDVMHVVYVGDVWGVVHAGIACSNSFSTVVSWGVTVFLLCRSLSVLE